MMMFMTSRNTLIAAALILLSLPLLICVFLWARAVHGQALVAQDRRNRHGTPYRHWRFRTAAPARSLEPAGLPGDRFASYALAPVTRLGILLYRTRIDELPALWNVMVGDIDLREFVAVFAETAAA